MSNKILVAYDVMDMAIESGSDALSEFLYDAQPYFEIHYLLPDDEPQQKYEQFLKSVDPAIMPYDENTYHLSDLPPPPHSGALAGFQVILSCEPQICGMAGKSQILASPYLAMGFEIFWAQCPDHLKNASEQSPVSLNFDLQHEWQKVVLNRNVIDLLAQLPDANDLPESLQYKSLQQVGQGLKAIFEYTVFGKLKDATDEKEHLLDYVDNSLLENAIGFIERRAAELLAMRRG